MKLFLPSLVRPHPLLRYPTTLSNYAKATLDKKLRWTRSFGGQTQRLSEGEGSNSHYVRKIISVFKKSKQGDSVFVFAPLPLLLIYCLLP